MSKLHTMQAAIALSPCNKACTTLENGDFFAIQEYQHEKYRAWAVAPGDVPVWGWEMGEDGIDELPEKGVNPGAHAWQPMGTADYQAIEGVAQTLYLSMETAMQALAGQVLSLRTELLAIKGMVSYERPEED